MKTIQEQTLTNIGNAIRSKTGSTDLISPTDMPTAIESITTGDYDNYENENFPNN